ncbi:MAG: HPr(Ser) kinase/phosphatase [Fibrobacteres bacterium CG2_30_45_31]|nr:MAG: HPr(Ser) kinase/phosphatase [Fibrobacteres bacterium CG2_30_45_31]
MVQRCFDNLEVQHRKHCSVLDFWKHYQSSLQLTLHTSESSLSSLIKESGLHRPGLAMAGFTSVFSSHQIQMIGSTEWSYLESLEKEKRQAIFQDLSAFRSPLWVLTHNLKPHAELIAMCEQQNVPLISTQLQTVDFARATQRILEEYFAPYTSVHASLVDVYGVGMLYLGESNVGKSECVLDLVERGHRLVADDVVQLSHVGNSIIGRSNSLIRHHMEIRGIGIIDVRSMFGIHAVRKVKKVEVLVELQPWQQNTTYDRTGLSSTVDEIMGVKIPRVLIPVSPGKNLTVISEVIAMNTLMKMSGLDTASAFNESLLRAIEQKTHGRRLDDAFEEDPLNWDSYE